MADTKRFGVVKIPDLEEDAPPISITKVEWGVRQIKPSHGRHLTGRFPLGKGRGSVPFESGLERDVMSWAVAYPGLVDLRAQPVTVHAWVGDARVTYTSDLLLEYSELPKALAELGFELKTFVEVKPLEFCNDKDMFMKLNILKLATGIQVVLLTRI